MSLSVRPTVPQVCGNLKTLMFRDLADFELTQMPIMRKVSQSVQKLFQMREKAQACKEHLRQEHTQNIE